MKRISKLIIIAILFLKVFYINAQVNLQNGLVAFYPFNGNANDESGNGNNGTVFSASLTSDRFGKLNSAYYFDGNAQYISIAHNSNLNPNTGSFSYCFWAKTSYSGGQNPVIEKLGNNANNGYRFDFNPNDIFWFFDDNTNVWDCVGTYSTTSHYDNNWHFYSIVLDREAKQLRFYIDGKQMNPSISRTIANQNVNYSGPLYIGRFHNYSSNTYFRGFLDDFRFYNRVLNSEEISALLQAGNIQFSNISTSKISLKWKKGTLNKCIVLMKEGEKGSNVAPISGNSYTSSNNWLNKSSEIASSGYFVVYKGDGDSTLVYNLNYNKTYWFRVFEYADSPEILYNTNISDWNTASTATLPTLNEGLVANYPFNANAKDASENTNNGVVNGATLAVDRFGNDSSAYSFDGNNDCINISSLSNLQYKPITYSVWIKPASLKTNVTGTEMMTILGRYFGCNPNPMGCLTIFNQPSGEINTMGYYTGDAYFSSGIKPQVNLWCHIVYTWDSNNNAKIYINGQLVRSATYNSVSTLNTMFKIGAGLSCNGIVDDRFFHGSIDDIRIYNRVLNENEVLSLYNVKNSISFSNVSTSSFSINFENKKPLKHLVLVKEGETGIDPVPQNGVYYSASNNWTQKGSQIGASGYYVVYNGSENSVYLSGLKSNTKYWVQVLEFDDTYGIIYNLTSNQESSKSICTLPSLQDGLVAYFPFNGNANDESGKGNDGTAMGNVSLTTNRFGEKNSAYNFNGGYIKLNNCPLVSGFNNISEFTISLWLNSSKIPSGSMFVQSTANGNYSNLTLYLSDQKAYYDVFPPPYGFLGSPQLITLNTWKHLVIERKGNYRAIYLDGTLVATDNSAEQYTNTGGYGNDLNYNVSQALIGKTHQTNNGWDFNGKLDDIRIYNRLLSEKEIKILYNESTLSEDGLVAMYPCDGNGFDASGNGLHASQNLNITGSSDRFGNLNSALNFNGSAIYRIHENSDKLNFGTGDFSICLWMKSNAFNNVYQIIGKDSHSATSVNVGYYLQYLNNNTILFTTRDLNSTNYLSSVKTLPEGWNLITGVRKSNILYLYINGELWGTLPETTKTNVSSNADFKIGRFDEGTQPSFNGNLDDIRIYNRALSLNEIKKMLTKNLLDGRIAYYPFNGNANDESGNGHNGIVRDATLTTDRFGRSNQSYFFNGVNSVITANSSDFPLGNSTRTLNFWFKFQYNPNAIESLIIGYGNTYLSNGSFHLYFHRDEKKLTFTQYGIAVKGTTVMQTEKWYFASCVYTGSKIILYLDGKKEIEWVYNINTGSANNLLNLGDNYYVTNRMYKGCIDDVSIYKRALNEVEIQALYAQDQANGLVAYYPFNGNANDESGNNNHGLVTGATLTSDRFGKPNRAYSFNGIDNNINCGNAASLAPSMTDKISVSAWVKFYDLTNSQCLLGKWGNSPVEYILYKDPSNNIIWNINNIDPIVYPLNPVCNKWYHIIAVSDENNKKLYINGQLVQVGSGIASINSSSNGLILGYESSGPSILNGVIDDIRIYNRVLTSNEIEQLYDLNPNKGLLACFPFTGHTNDISGNNNHGIAKNGLTFNFDRFGQPSSAATFDGIDDYIDLTQANLDFSKDFTLSGWIKISIADAKDFNPIFGNWINNPGFALSVNADKKLHFNGMSFALDLKSNTEVCDDKWRHVLVKRKAGVGYVYADGTLQSTQFLCNTDETNKGENALGNWSALLEPGRFFKGTMDDVRFYNRALSDEEIDQLANDKVKDPFSKAGQLFNAPWWIVISNNSSDTVLTVDRYGNLFIRGGNLKKGGIFPNGNFTSNSTIINDRNGTPIFAFNTKYSYVKNEILENQCNDSLDNFSVNNLVIKNALGNVVARFDEITGNIYIKGKLVILADAGNDVFTFSYPVNLSGNLISGTTGQWTVVNGTGGSFSDSSLNNTTFTGIPGIEYTLRWTLNHGTATSYDEVKVVKLNLGDEYQGGKIAYFFQPGDPGYIAGETHGIIVAPSDQATFIKFWNGSFTRTGAIASELGSGKSNTDSIVASQGVGDYPAKICYDLVINGYDDWYLPSSAELSKLYLSKDIIGGYSVTYYYWSSTEHNSSSDYDYYYVYVQEFNTGFAEIQSKNINACVRAIRTF